MRQTTLWLGALALATLPLLGGCSLFGGRPDTLAPAGKLYEEGERDLGRGRYEAARDQFRKIVERHPDSSMVPQARFLVGETYYRDKEWDRAAREFDAFMALYPGHAIADLAQYRLARSYFDGMPELERDQAMAARALSEFQRLLKLYPESRYAPDAIVKIDACRLRLAQKELWVADWYVRQSNWVGAIQRYDVILKDYGRTSAAAQALYQKADALLRLERGDEARSALQKLVDDFPQSEWARRARQRQTSELRPSS
jgi:outer membrane protein assembly factor BamD